MSHALGICRVVVPCLLLLPVLTACGGAGAGEAGQPPAAGTSGGPSGATPVGTIAATVAGEARTWNVLHLQREDGLKSTGIYRARRLFRNTDHSIILGGHTGTTIAMANSIHLILNTIEPLDRCPCRLEGQSIEYWTSSPAQHHEGRAVVTLDRFAANPDGSYQAAGSFAGTLRRAVDGGTPAPVEEIRVEGTFDVARILVSAAGG